MSAGRLSVIEWGRPTIPCRTAIADAKRRRRYNDRVPTTRLRAAV